MTKGYCLNEFIWIVEGGLVDFELELNLRQNLVQWGLWHINDPRPIFQTLSHGSTVVSHDKCVACIKGLFVVIVFSSTAIAWNVPRAEKSKKLYPLRHQCGGNCENSHWVWALAFIRGNCTIPNTLLLLSFGQWSWDTQELPALIQMFHSCYLCFHEALLRPSQTKKLINDMNKYTNFGGHCASEPVWV